VLIFRFYKENEVLLTVIDTLRKVFCGAQLERIPDAAFVAMSFLIRVRNALFRADKRIETFGIRDGHTVIDYGCGPGVHVRRASELVGRTGRVYAVDVHRLAVESVNRIIDKYDLSNVEAVLAHGYSCSLDDHIADVIYALDMFHMVREPTAFLYELHRLLKRNGYLIIDHGHQSRELAKAKMRESGVWDIVEEYRRGLKCAPIPHD
jgi:ubiquinone/menaquinone biosynthesis C-methylase UbiE